jgi:hypothetical protein
VDLSDVRLYTTRDWAAVAEIKRAFWKSLSRVEALRLGDDLRQQVEAWLPEWPEASDRREDLSAHARLAELFERVDEARRR